MAEKKFKIQGGGIGLIINTMASVFFWFIFVMALFEARYTKPDLMDFVLILVIGAFLCPYTTVVNYKFWKSNYIEITDKELLISVLDRPVRRNWPKYNKKSIRLDEIETMSLEKPAGITLAPSVKIEINNSKPYYIDTKPFSKASFWKLFNELEKIGIKVVITAGAI